MLDDFRNQASIFDEEESFNVEPPSYETRRDFLGMTAGQRFIIVLILMVLTFLLSTVVLIVSGKMSLPFMY